MTVARYISHDVLNGLLPNISEIISEGFFAIADAAIPTFTTPKNMSIVTRVAAKGGMAFLVLAGQPPAPFFGFSTITWGNDCSGTQL